MKKNKRSNPKRSTQAGARSRISSKTKKSRKAVGGPVRGKRKEYEYKSEVTGKGILIGVKVSLDGVPVPLRPSNGLHWEGSIKLWVGDVVRIDFVCIAPNGTGWAHKVTNTTKDRTIHGKSGQIKDMNKSEYREDAPSE